MKIELGEKISEGSTAIVYRDAQRPHLAVKVLREEHMIDAYVIQRFVAEFDYSNRVDHPRVLRFTEQGLIDDRVPYLVSEMLDGKLLSDVIFAADLARPVILPVMTYIAEGLAAIHSAGLIHLDMKPHNIFMCSDGTLKIIDFGSAEMVGVQSHNGSFSTATYSPPECWRRGNLAGTQASDIYSLGCVFHEMLSGSPPFVSQGIKMPLGNQHAFYAPPSLPDHPANSLIVKMLEKDPLDRPSIQEVLSKLLTLAST